MSNDTGKAKEELEVVAPPAAAPDTSQASEPVSADAVTPAQGAADANAAEVSFGL